MSSLSSANDDGPSAAELIAAVPAATLAEVPSDGAFSVILFYLYTPVSAPLEPVVEWQRALCSKLGLVGRIRLASEGINATLAGSRSAVAAYVHSMRTTGPPAPHPDSSRLLFAPVAYKFSTSATNPFTTLNMFLVPELTASGKMGKSRPLGLQQLRKNGEEAKQQAEHCAAAGDSPAIAASSSSSPASSSASAASSQNGASSDMHLTPAQFHEALTNFDPATTICIDTRNAYETSIGMFEHAVDPKLRAFHQLPEYINQNLPELRSKKTVLMYCTGGIRCEKAALYLKHRTEGMGTKVLQLEGGIHKYLDAYPDGGHFRGKNFVFDGRWAMGSTDPRIVGKCVHCARPEDGVSDEQVCTVCKSFIQLCPGCKEMYAEKRWKMFCSEHMLLAAAEGAPEIGEDGSSSRRQEKKRRRSQANGAASTQTNCAADGDSGVDAVNSGSRSVSAAPVAASSSAAASSAPAAPASASSSSSAAAGPLEEEAEVDPDSRPDEPLAPGGDGSSLGCEEQWQSFLSRFPTPVLAKQLAEMDGILAYFASPKQRKNASRSRNRKANLHTQRRRLAAYLEGRRAAEASNPPPAGVAEDAASSAPATAAATAPQLLSFVPFLNM